MDACVETTFFTRKILAIFRDRSDDPDAMLEDTEVHVPEAPSRKLTSIGLTLEQVIEAFRTPTQLVFVGRKGSLRSIRWFKNGDIIFAGAQIVKMSDGWEKIEQIEVSFALKLRARLPAGDIEQSMDILKLHQIIGDSFGFELEPDKSAPRTRLYSGAATKIVRIHDVGVREELAAMACYDNDDQVILLCALSLDKYLAWLEGRPQPVFVSRNSLLLRLEHGLSIQEEPVASPEPVTISRSFSRGFCTLTPRDLAGSWGIISFDLDRSHALHRESGFFFKVDYDGYHLSLSIENDTLVMRRAQAELAIDLSMAGPTVRVIAIWYPEAIILDAIGESAGNNNTLSKTSTSQKIATAPVWPPGSLLRWVEEQGAQPVRFYPTLHEFQQTVVSAMQDVVARIREY